MLLPVPLFHANGCHTILFPQTSFGGMDGMGETPKCRRPDIGSRAGSGASPHARALRLGKDKITELVERYQAGANVCELADEFEIKGQLSPSTCIATA
jgi:hypothetical protein